MPTCYRHPGREAYIRCQRCDRPICPDCMTPASVGFQCPDCLRQGQRETRQPTSRWIGNAGFRSAPVTYVILAINVVVFALVNLLPGRDGNVLLFALMQHTHGIGVADQLNAYYPAGVGKHVCQLYANCHWSPGVSDGAPWQLLTSVFTHQAIWHIGSNMFALWVIGPQLEQLLGRWRYLTLYLVSGLCGSLLVLALANPNTPSLGASGAIFGLMGALVVLFLRARASLQPLVFPLVLNFAITFTVPNIAWQAHVGGFIGGIVVVLVMLFLRERRRVRR